MDKKILIYFESLDKLSAIFAGFLMFAALTISFSEIIARYIFEYSFYWAEEISIYLVIWSTFFGACSATQKGEHIRVQIFIRRLNRNVIVKIELVCTVLCIAFSVLLFSSGISLVYEAKSYGTASISLLQAPLYIPYLIVPLGAGLMTLQLLYRLIKLLTSPDDIVAQDENL